MTREKALKEVNHVEGRWDTKVLIDKIFDDFESRTCKNCKHIKGIKPKLGQTFCDIHKEDLENNMGVSLDFGCNRWVLK
jgi:hypothetical protein